MTIPVLRTARDLRDLDGLRGARPLVFVPTMGALHAGHLELVRRGAQLGPVVVSIFVNPMQFGPGEDFAQYPRNLGQDLALLEPCGVSAVFTPPAETMYGREVGVTVQPGPRAAGLCGASRPGHFAGVLTVVAKLFNLVRPDVAIFGRKDAQQCLVIAEMVRRPQVPRAPPRPPHRARGGRAGDVVAQRLSRRRGPRAGALSERGARRGAGGARGRGARPVKSCAR